MIKKIIVTIKKNSLIVLGAAVFAVGIFYVVKNPNIFMASVLSLQEQQFILDKGRDIAYKTSSGIIEIFMAEKMETPLRIDFTLNFDKDTITVDTQNIRGQGTYELSKQSDNEINISISSIQDREKNEGLVSLPFVGESKDILLSEAVVTLNNGKQKNLSIGTLNETNFHRK